MATGTRGANGKFVKGTTGEPIGAGVIDTDFIAGTESGPDGGPEIVIDPAAASAERRGDNSDGPGAAKRGRGRPAGSGKKEKPETQARPEISGKLDLDSLNFTLFYAHALLAKATKTPELELDETEAKTLAQSAMNVMNHYNIKASQKAIDWGNFLLTAGIIYGGKLHAVSERHALAKRGKQEESQSVVAPFGFG